MKHPLLLLTLIPMALATGSFKNNNNGYEKLATTTIEYRHWRTALALQMATLRIKINNFTPRDFQDTSGNTFRWYKRNDCHFKIGFRPNEIEQTFNLLPFRANPMTIYIQNLNSSNTNVSADNGRIKFRINFESRDLEI